MLIEIIRDDVYEYFVYYFFLIYIITYIYQGVFIKDKLDYNAWDFLFLLFTSKK